MSARTDPMIVSTRPGLRLVHTPRDPQHWPNMSDLVLEREAKDAMGALIWVTVTSWCLSETPSSDIFKTPPAYTHIVALKMLLDAGPVIK